MKDLKKISFMIKEKNRNDGASGSCVMHRKDPLYSASNALEQASDRYPKSVCLFIWVVYLFVHIYIYFSFISLIVCLYVILHSYLFIYLFLLLLGICPFATLFVCFLFLLVDCFLLLESFLCLFVCSFVWQLRYLFK